MNSDTSNPFKSRYLLSLLYDKFVGALLPSVAWSSAAILTLFDHDGRVIHKVELQRPSFSVKKCSIMQIYSDAFSKYVVCDEEILYCCHKKTIQAEIWYPVAHPVISLIALAKVMFLLSETYIIKTTRGRESKFVTNLMTIWISSI